ncbi:hypothetical protein ACHHYP_07967 [Achlya hypogyna]|uniref:EF-hand domain-containing protein n=1 Tax=Achlya hypogyna TaxID=1202772 RepID=A0A1V9YQ15_ACHHY|nr:hypothetical protein ACHHYP_07967 [Achlya hypogyna]
MGSRYSKGPIRKDARPLLPATWEELIALDRYLGVHHVLFLRDISELQAWLPTKDVLSAKRVFTFPLCALDLLAAFSLLQHSASASKKLEFVGHLLKNGPECNKSELMIAMGYAVRGIARLKGLQSVPDAQLRFLANQVFGPEAQLPWAVVVPKLLVLPDIVYFLSDLDMVAMDSLESLIGEQAHLMKDLAHVEHDLAVLEHTQARQLHHVFSVDLHGWLFHTGFDLHRAVASSSRRTPQTPIQINIDACARQIFKAFQPETKAANSSGSKRSLAAIEAKRSFREPDELINFLFSISDGTVQLPLAEARVILDDLPKDQLERVLCSDLLRWFKHWAYDQNHRGHSAFDHDPLWKHAAKSVAALGKRVVDGWDRLRSALSMGGGKPATRLRMDEAQYSVVAHVEPPKQPPLEPKKDGLGARLFVEFYDPLPEETMQDDAPAAQILEVGFPTALSVEVLVWRDVTGIAVFAKAKNIMGVVEAAVDRLALLLSEFLNDYNVLEGFAGLYQRATVNVMHGLREHSVVDVHTTAIASDKYYLRVTFLSHRNLAMELQDICQAPLRDVVDKFHCQVVLGPSLQDLISHAKQTLELFRSSFDSKHPGALEDILRLLFARYDRDASGILELDEINALQQSRGIGVVANEADLRDLLEAEGLQDGPKVGLTFPAFVESFGKYSGVYDSVRQLGGLNNILHGSLSCVLAVNRHWMTHLEANAAPSVWRATLLKWTLLFAQHLTDVTAELSFPDALAGVRFCAPWLAECPILETPYWLVKQLYDLETLIWNSHSESHTADEIGCINLVCAAKSSFAKLEHQRSAKQQPSAAETFEMESMRKFLELHPVLEASVCGLQQVSIVTRTAALHLELDHFALAKCAKTSP